MQWLLQHREFRVRNSWWYKMELQESPTPYQVFHLNATASGRRLLEDDNNVTQDDVLGRLRRMYDEGRLDLCHRCDRYYDTLDVRHTRRCQEGLFIPSAAQLQRQHWSLKFRARVLPNIVRHTMNQSMAVIPWVPGYGTRYKEGLAQWNQHLDGRFN
jgi:hypothetical protein